MPRTPDDRIQAQARAIRGMRQYRDALANGEMSDDDVLRLAAERVLSTTPQGESQAVTREYFGTLARDAGDSLFPEPWFVGRTVEADELASNPHPIPVEYEVFAERAGGKLKRLIIDLPASPF